MLLELYFATSSVTKATFSSSFSVSESLSNPSSHTSTFDLGLVVFTDKTVWLVSLYLNLLFFAPKCDCWAFLHGSLAGYSWTRAPTGLVPFAEKEMAKNSEWNLHCFECQIPRVDIFLPQSTGGTMGLGSRQALKTHC